MTYVVGVDGEVVRHMVTQLDDYGQTNSWRGVHGDGHLFLHHRPDIGGVHVLNRRICIEIGGQSTWKR